MTIECKGLEPKTIKDFARYIILSNHDVPLRIEMGDGRIVCLDVSSRCKENMEYFKCLGKILDNPNTPGVFMNYLFKRNLSDWISQNISNMKMRAEIMQDQLPNSIQFIIDHTSSWPVEKIDRPYCTNLYQEYITWCENNGEKIFASAILGKKFPQIGIDKTHLQNNEKREYHYILNCSKIVAKLRESGLGDIKEFSDIPQPDLPENETTDIPIFNVLEIIPPKIIPPQPEKNVAEQLEVPIASTSKTSETIKLPESIEPINEVVNMPPKETPTNSSKPVTEVSSAILLAR